MRKSKIPSNKTKFCKASAVFNAKNKDDDNNELSKLLIRSAKRSGQLSLVGRGLTYVPAKLWEINELQLEKDLTIDFDRTEGRDAWWQAQSLHTLDLSSNVIQELSPNIKCLPDLTTLLLQDNAFESLPEEIGTLSALTKLNLSRNKITTLPDGFYKLIELRYLNISHNLLQTIDAKFGDLIMLTFLDLSNNCLNILPPGLGYLVRLVEINLSHNQLTELPPDIVNMRELRKLNVQNNSLKYLPTMSELRRMEILYANHNQIDELPSFYGCAALTEIHLSHNVLKEITEDFCENLQHLKVLNFSQNQIEKLPDNICLLQKLIRFDLTNNNLSAVPSNMGLLAHMQSLKLQGNKMASLRQDVLQGGTERVLKFLRNKLEAEEEHKEQTYVTWPDKFDLMKTQSLNLAARDLTAIPEDLIILAANENVHIVDFGKNKFSEVPLGLSKISDTLTQLILCSNQLTSIPCEIADCKKLQYMDLSKNRIHDLPMEFVDLKNMRELVISCNRFTKIPRCVYDMKSLEILLAQENQITEINISSDALANLKNLAVLDLSNNSIASVPPELGDFTQIRSLLLTGNCFRQPRQAVLEKGTLSILSYLRDRIPKN